MVESLRRFSQKLFDTINFRKEPETVEKPGYLMRSLLPHYETIETYWVNEPFTKVNIVTIPEMGGATAYFIEEVEFTEDEQMTSQKIIDYLSVELEPPIELEAEVDAAEHVKKEAKRIAMKYRYALGKFTDESWDKILYAINRDLVGFQAINVLMEDPHIEDISSMGVGKPVYVWHTDYESISTNLEFINEKKFDDLVIKMAHMGGKHVSAVFPIVDTMLYGKHRFAATYRREVTPLGSTFTIRKYREEPFSVIDLIKLKTINERVAAYFWVLLENRASLIVAGGTASGKTTSLNALATLIKPGMKIITVEETPEIRLLHENWVQFVSRPSYGLGTQDTGEIGLFNLVRTSLRYRPDYIVVGEVRGEEAFTLFQALAVGHGGMCTIHGENLDYVVKRLTSMPMNVSEIYIPLMNVIGLIERVSLPQAVAGLPYGRRLRDIHEVLGFGEYRMIFQWNPINDSIISKIGDSYLLVKIADRLGITEDRLLNELLRREVVLRWMVKANIVKVDAVAKIISEYYVNPTRVYERASKELGVPIEVDISATLGPPALAPTEVLEDKKSLEIDALAYDLLEMLIARGGEMSYGSMVSEARLSPIDFWRNIDALRSGQYIRFETETDEAGRLRSLVCVTDRGREALRGVIR
jgi:flagellar protein FlaI